MNDTISYIASYNLLNHAILGHENIFNTLFDMYFSYMCVVLSIIFYSSVDYILQQKVQGSYYIIHAFNNACIIGLTLTDTITLYTDPYKAFSPSLTIEYATYLTYGLHLYHILMYIKKLRYDDWLHHGLMIFVALPIGSYFGSIKLLSHSLFYTTGLPGMIDYICLSLVRNKRMERITEKKINRYLNTYIRNPGCTIHAYITLINVMMYDKQIERYDFPYEASLFNITVSLISAIIVFWNGIYFMDQVVGNLYIEREKTKYNLPKDYNV